jgi:hypothetical protein
MCSILSYALASLAIVAALVVLLLGGAFIWAIFKE